MGNRKKYIFDPHKDPFINGYKCGLRPRAILAVVKIRGSRYCIMKWKGTEDASFVKYTFARDKFPVIVIKFYEQLAIQLQRE
ncbi:chromobox protein 3-like [Aphis craccivora]|uniref:Chromobox protein 3-like n=1 Tax=Aphis craccivora TaxID=307492 RepID=A0A6G0ZEA3_APHCR|nr:chromobox protein 3-like [Aphis craccivora]